MSNEIETKIRVRAYELWESEGCQSGREFEYWTRAEHEILEEPIMAARALADKVSAAAKPKAATRPRAKTKVA